MAIALDVATNGSFVDPGTSRTWSHTCTGTNLVLVVGTMTQSGSDVVTGITYNTIAMTRATLSTLASAGTTYLYTLVAPSTGANNVVASLSSSVSSGFLSASYTGCAQTGQPDESNSGTSTAAGSVTVSIGSQAAGSWIVGVANANLGSASGYIAGSNTTIRVTNDGYGRFVLVDSNGNTTISQTYQWTGVDNGVMSITELLQAGGAVASVYSQNNLTLLGVS